MPNSALFTPEDWPAALDMFRRTLAGESIEVEFRLVRKDGERRWTETRTSQIYIDERPAVVVVARDVTERRRVADELRKNDAALGLVLDALNSGFYTVDPQLVVTSVRGKGSGSGSALVGKSVVAIAPSAEEAVVQREQHKRALDGEVVTWVWPVGGGNWVRSHVAPIRNAAGDVTGVAGFWRDESAIMRARDEQDARWNRFRTSSATRAPET
jgi:PAS domain-containing protein